MMVVNQGIMKYDQNKTEIAEKWFDGDLFFTLDGSNLSFVVLSGLNLGAFVVWWCYRGGRWVFNSVKM